MDANTTCRVNVSAVQNHRNIPLAAANQTTSFWPSKRDSVSGPPGPILNNNATGNPMKTNHAMTRRSGRLSRLKSSAHRQVPTTRSPKKPMSQNNVHANKNKKLFPVKFHLPMSVKTSTASCQLSFSIE